MRMANSLLVLVSSILYLSGITLETVMPFIRFSVFSFESMALYTTVIDIFIDLGYISKPRIQLQWLRFKLNCTLLDDLLCYREPAAWSRRRDVYSAA